MLRFACAAQCGISQHNQPLLRRNAPDRRLLLWSSMSTSARASITREIICNSMKTLQHPEDKRRRTCDRQPYVRLSRIDLQDKCWILLGKYNLKMLILTCGINGSYVFTPATYRSSLHRKSKLQTPSAPATALPRGVHSFHTKRKSVQEAHSLAVQTSAYVCTKKGAMPILPELTA